MQAPLCVRPRRPGPSGGHTGDHRLPNPGRPGSSSPRCPVLTRTPTQRRGGPRAPGQAAEGGPRKLRARSHFGEGDSQGTAAFVDGATGNRAPLGATERRNPWPSAPSTSYQTARRGAWSSRVSPCRRRPRFSKPKLRNQYFTHETEQFICDRRRACSHAGTPTGSASSVRPRCLTALRFPTLVPDASLSPTSAVSPEARSARVRPSS